MIAMVPVEKNWPTQLLLLTTLTLLTFEYGMLVMATRFPTNDLSWMMIRRLVSPRKPVPAPIASYTAMICSPSSRPLSICWSWPLLSKIGAVIAGRLLGPDHRAVCILDPGGQGDLTVGDGHAVRRAEQDLRVTV